MVERRSGEVAVPLSTKKIFKRVVPTDMQTAVKLFYKREFIEMDTVET